MTLEARPNAQQHFSLNLPDINQKRMLKWDDLNILEPQDFFMSGLRVAQRYCEIPFSGYDIQITSEIPINAGISSSSALVVSWMHFLLKTFGDKDWIDPLLLAQAAYEAEVLEHNSPGGKMDQYAIALGHILYLETGAKLEYTVFKNPLKTLILAESGIPKDTIGTLKNVRSLTLKSVSSVQDYFPNFNIHTATLEGLDSYAMKLDAGLQPYFLAAIQNHVITQKALHEFTSGTIDIEYLGRLMYSHHGVLRDLLQVSHPTIDRFIDGAMQAGAYGGKIVGSGGGGCAIVLCDLKNKEEVIESLVREGAKKAYEINITPGSYVV